MNLISTCFFSRCCWPLFLCYVLSGPAAAQVTDLPPRTSLALQAWVKGYVDVMPAEKHLLAVGPGFGAAVRTWNASAYEALAVACQAERGACREFLIDSAEKLFSKAVVSRANLTYKHAAMLSAYTDLCLAIPRLARLEEDGRSCPYLDTVQLLYVVAELWNELGYDDLFLYYVRRYMDERALHLKWVTAYAKDELARVERELIPISSSFAAVDMREKEGAARRARFELIVMLQPDVIKKKDARFRLVVRKLERLAWESGELAVAERWADVQRALGPGPTGDCREAQESWRVRLARQIALGLAPDALRDAAQAPHGTCRFQGGLVEAAAQLLQTPSAATRAAVARALKDRLKLCAVIKDSCPPLAIVRINDLLDLASADRERLIGLANRTLSDRSPYAFTQVDRLIGWAVGLRLLEKEDTRALGKSLLDTRIVEAEYADENEFNPYGATLRDTLRYADHVKRYLADAAQHQESVKLTLFEHFRHRSQLRRLQLARRTARLDAIGISAPSTNPAAPLLRRVIDDGDNIAQRSSNKLEQALGSALAEIARFSLQEIELDMLATRAMQWALLQDPKALPTSWASDDRQALQLMKRTDFGSFMTSETKSLAQEESYLSWLKVPGGFVAMLVAAQQYGDHAVSSRFIPFSQTDDRDLAYYLTLLQSDVSAKRGGILVSASQPPAPVTGRSFARLQERLSQRLIEPFAAGLGFTARLVISPDASLTRLPFETLTLSGKPLLKSKIVSYVQSLAMHAELKERAKHYRTAAKVLSIAAPMYASGGLVQADSTIPLKARSAIWPALPGTFKESTDLFDGAAIVERWLGWQASRAHVKEASTSGQLADYSVIHFATHAYVDESYSALVMSGPNGTTNAFLSADDIARLRLRSALIILSACSTAFGKSESGEGIVGLPYAFVQAGNINSVISLWPVDDEGAAAFMIEYTRRLHAGVPVQMALTQTKSYFAEGHMGRALARPQVWAAFVTLGVEMNLP